VSIRRLSLLVLALLYTGLNALKPLQIDDAAYERYARHLADRPLDPYGFVVHWYDWPEPAMQVLAPPVLPYYWGLVRKVVGEEPWRWKLGLLPWVVVFVAAVARLWRRFAPRLELLGTWMVVLSPAVLPSLNLMLDVPALALSLASLCVFMRAVEKDSLGLSALAGLVVGLAMQTKYTALLAPGAMLLYALVYGRLRLWPAAAVVAAQVFVCWELLLVLLYGTSHFVESLPPSDSDPWEKFGQLPALFSQLGGVAPAGIVLAMAALRLRGRWLVATVVVLALGYVPVALLDARFVNRTVPSPMLFGEAPVTPVDFQLAEPIFFAYGVVGTILVLLVALRLLRLEAWRRERKGDPDHGSTFLVLWLALEVVGFVVLTPFPALRRVLGVGVVLALLVGRLAAHTCRAPERRRVLWWIAAGGTVLGLGFFALDFRGARVQQEVVERAARWVQEHGGGRVWYVGHWGFQFYAEREGMEAVIPYYEEPQSPIPPPSKLRRGDWLVVPDPRQNQQGLALGKAPLELMETVVIYDGFPLRTVPCFYGGRTPVEHQEGSCLEVRVYRVVQDFTPRSGEPSAFQMGH
jgi:4-amino-4-deoxy-L-arabinose transferase-like glycosyltransferase